MSQLTVEIAPKVIPFSTRRARGQCEVVVFWERLDGDIMMAPHTLMKPFPGYRKVECSTVRDIERMSKKMASQEENKLRGMKVAEQLRSAKRWEEIATNCKLRLAQGCISSADEALTRTTLKSVERKMNMLVQLMTGSESMLTGCLEIEKTSAPIGMAEFAKKKVVVE